MSFAQEKLEDSLRRLRVRQDLADARLAGVEAAAEAAAAPSAGSAGAVPESALFQGLGRYAHWKPPAFAVWWVSGGGGRVGVSVPEGCVSWDGEPFPASALSPAPQEDRKMRVRWCEVPPPEAPRTVLFAAVVAPFDRTTGEAGGPDEVRLVWAESEAELRGRLDTESRHVAAAVPVAEYDSAGDRLVQVHVGALALGGGGGGGDTVTPDDVSTEFIPDPPSGTSPDGDEGRLQIKDWKNTSLVDPNSLADYSQGVVAIPQNGIQVVARFPQTGGPPLLSYVPLAQLTKKYISAGENIVVTEQGDNIIVSSPGGGGGGTTPDTSADGVSDTFIVGGQVSYSASTRKFTQPLWRLTFQNGVLVEKLELTQAEIQAVQETLP